MSHEDIVLDVRVIAERVAHSFGLTIFDVQFRQESIGWIVRVFIDGPQLNREAATDQTQETVNVDDCQRVSRDLSAVLDADFTFNHEYTLEVSSPGLDRPLRHLDDCRRFTGRLAKIVTKETVDGLNYVAGRITGVDDDHVIVDTAFIGFRGQQCHELSSKWSSEDRQWR